jgi:hypothetical protein
MGALACADDDNDIEKTEDGKGTVARASDEFALAGIKLEFETDD